MKLQSDATENKVAEILQQAVSECNEIQIAAAEKVAEVRRKAEACGAKDGRRARNGGYSMACVKPKGHDGNHEDCCGCWWQ